MVQRLIEMKYIKHDGHRLRGDVVAITRMAAGLLEARGVAVRVRPAHSKQKPITELHSVTKEE